MNEEGYVTKLKNLLIKSLKKSIEPIKSEKIAMALSGGLDSTIIAKLLKDLGIEQTAYVVGIENCKDFDSAENYLRMQGVGLIRFRWKHLGYPQCYRAQNQLR